MRPLNTELNAGNIFHLLQYAILWDGAPRGRAGLQFFNSEILRHLGGHFRLIVVLSRVQRLLSMFVL
jgi:hypothetical protein